MKIYTIIEKGDLKTHPKKKDVWLFDNRLSFRNDDKIIRRLYADKIHLKDIRSVVYRPE
jgi:hypothetical protein